MAIETTADLEATTYATVDDADAAAEIRRGSAKAAWDALTDDDDKLAALTAASRDLDTLDWIGDRATDEQALEWPRTDTDYADDAWPQRLIDAVIELAFANAPKYLSGATTDPLNPNLAGAPNVKRQKIGPIEKEFFAPTTTAANIGSIERFPPIVQNLIRPLVRDAAAASSEWGSSVARRAS